MLTTKQQQKNNFSILNNTWNDNDLAKFENVSLKKAGLYYLLYNNNTRRCWKVLSLTHLPKSTEMTKHQICLWKRLLGQAKNFSASLVKIFINNVMEKLNSSAWIMKVANWIWIPGCGCLHQYYTNNLGKGMNTFPLDHVLLQVILISSCQ